MTEPISPADAEYAARITDTRVWGAFRPARPTLSPQEPSAFEVDPLKGKVEVPAPRSVPVSPGRLGAVNAAILQNLPSAIDHVAKLAETSEDLNVRLQASRLLVEAAGQRTPASLVDAAKAVLPIALASLTTLATGRIPGAQSVAVEATEILINQLKR